MNNSRDLTWRCGEHWAEILKEGSAQGHSPSTAWAPNKLMSPQPLLALELHRSRGYMLCSPLCSQALAQHLAHRRWPINIVD